MYVVFFWSDQFNIFSEMLDKIKNINNIIIILIDVINRKKKKIKGRKKLINGGLKKMITRQQQNAALSTYEFNEFIRIYNEQKNNLTACNSDQLQAITAGAIFEKLKKKFMKIAEIENINITEKINDFLCLQKSEKTKQAYNKGLNDFFGWIAKNKIEFSEIESKEAINYLRFLNEQGKSKKTILLKLAIMRAFYNYLVDSENLEIQNPFENAYKKSRLSKVLQATRKNNNKFYLKEVTGKEIERIENDLNYIIDYYSQKDKTTASILLIIKYTGMRIGGFNENFKIENNKIHTISKGKEYTAPISEELRAEIKAINGTWDFSAVDTSKETQKINHTFMRLYKQGKISKLYTVHDFRHLFAIRMYRANRDICQIKKILNHSSILVTENYLKGLGFTV